MTDQDMMLKRFHQNGVSGEQRIYRWGDWGLSVVNGRMLHAYPFAREAAVVYFHSGDPLDFELVYTTPLTSDVEIFESDDEADVFVARAREYFTQLTYGENARIIAAHEARRG